MLFPTLLLSAIFMILGFVLTEKTAPYLLSGYNTLPEKDRKNMDLTAFIPFFRRFHIGLGLATAVLGIGICYTISDTAGGIFIGIFPLVAYLYFMWRSRRFIKGTQPGSLKLGMTILALTVLLVGGLFYFGIQENALVIGADEVEFTGMYGEKIRVADIAHLELAAALPPIRHRSNGFSMGQIRKGWYATQDGPLVKLLVNSNSAPYLLLTQTNGKQLYYNMASEPSTAALERIQAAFPTIMVR